MYQFICLLVVLSSLTVTAQTINVRGKVTNGDGGPISGAVVTLLELDLKDTTGEDGTYAITQTTSVMAARHTTVPGRVTIAGNQLEFKLFKSSSLTIEVFDIKSNLVTSEKKDGVALETYRWDISKQHLANQLLIVRASIDNMVTTFSYMPLTGRYSRTSDSKSTASSNGILAKMAASVSDTLEVQATGYSTKLVALDSYDTTVDVTLNSATTDKWGGLKNPPRKSAGCGKAAAIRSGMQKIRSSNKDRSYIVNIPDNYDQDKPYRLIYTSHGLGGHAADLADENWIAYYGLKEQAKANNESAIFVAPEAIGSWCPTNGQGDQDHILFDDITDYVEDCLCVDTSRVFTAGMSWGGMYTYSLSTNRQYKIRAAVAMCAVNYQLWIPNPKIKEPIAWMQTSGMSDRTCPWDAGNGRGSKYIALEKAADNGCKVPNDIQTWKRGDPTRHLIVDMEDCDEGYPVKVCTFDEGHYQFPYDSGPGEDRRKSWVPVEAWKFISQF